jgi:hypothetical protein
LNVPTGYNLGSAEWHAQNPHVQKERDRCLEELEKLRKILRDAP